MAGRGRPYPSVAPSRARRANRLAGQPFSQAAGRCVFRRPLQPQPQWRPCRIGRAIGFAVGVDLERLRERRFDAWPDWVLHEDEARWLQRHSELSDRYALWTLKEALLKATGQALADLPQVGLRRRDGGTDGWRLCAAGKLWRGVVFLLDGEWVCAAVWPQEVSAVPVWQGFGNWRDAERRLLYDFV